MFEVSLLRTSNKKTTMHPSFSGNRKRSLSKSPTRMEFGRRPQGKFVNKRDSGKNENNMNMNMMVNQPLFPPGNMVMGGMFQNMIMPGAMMPNMLPPGAMDLLSTGSMEMMSHQQLDMNIPPVMSQPSGMDMMGGMMLDPPMMSIFPNMSQMPTMAEKVEIVLKSCKLIPPRPDSSNPPTRPRPPGCKTIFVGGLPDQIREHTIKEIFERYGRIITMRLSSKNFCHIRFDNESSVDTSIALSGYKLVLTEDRKDADDEDEPHSHAGWIHVDYAMSRDDQNEYKRKQRQAMRLQQPGGEQYATSQDALSDDFSLTPRKRSPSPIKIHPFSQTAILQIAERIKNEEYFASTLPTLIAWLEKGECSKKTSNQFYSMIQATNSHIRRLFNDKIQCDEDLQVHKDKIKSRIEKIIWQLEQVARVFNAATHQRVWDHFTKPQRKNIDTWQKMAQEFTNLKDEFYEKFYDESDYDRSNGGKSNMEIDIEVNELKQENRSLKVQLEAYKNEIDVVRADNVKEMEKFKAQFIARQALQCAFDYKNSPIPHSPVAEDLNRQSDVMSKSIEDHKAALVVSGDAKLIGVMSAFLQVHPQGASLDYVVSYVRAIFPNISHANVHQVLQKYNDVFERRTMGVGANIEHRWLFCAYKGI